MYYLYGEVFDGVIDTKTDDDFFFCINFQKFKHIMKELQGAIIIGSAFQTFLGYSGLMSLLVRYDCGIFYTRLFVLFFSTHFTVSSQ